MEPEIAEAFCNDAFSMRDGENKNTRIKQAVLSEIKTEPEYRRWTVTRWEGPFVQGEIGGVMMEKFKWCVNRFFNAFGKTGVFLRERETKRIEQIGFDSCFITVSIL